MKKIESTQKGVLFIFCPNPITIDKRGSWGDHDDNFQKAPNGGFLKMKDNTTVSHLVQPNEDKSAPVGWIPGEAPGLFDKKPIWVDENVIPSGEKKVVDTLDGRIEYQFDEPSMLVCNDLNGEPNLGDAWVSKVQDVKKNYVL